MLKQSSKIEFQKSVTFSDDLVGIHKLKTNCIINRPVFIGQAILDLSKTQMCHFVYDFLFKNFPNARINYSDTDSLIYSVQTKVVDYNNILKKNKDLFDTSNFPKDHELFSKVNQKALGKLKFETEEKFINEFIGLKAKMYSYTVDGDNSIYSKAKGTKKLLTKKMHIDYYKDVLFNDKELFVEQSGFKSILHDIHTYVQVKKSLAPFDDKHYILEDRITCLPFGHYSVGTRTDLCYR